MCVCVCVFVMKQNKKYTILTVPILVVDDEICDHGLRLFF